MSTNDLNRSEHGWQTCRRCPFLDRRFTITIIPENEGAEPTVRQLQVLESLESIPSSFMDAVDDHVTAYRRRSMNLLRQSLEACSWLARFIGLTPDRDPGEALGTEYEITEIVIPQLESTPDECFFMNAECDWDPEHGMEILVCNGRIVHCGTQEMPYFIGSDWRRYIS